MNYYVSVLKNYATFSGRARRAEYWMFTLIDWVITIVLALMVNINGLFYSVFFVYLVALLIPSLAVRFRRLHDTDHSGWWIFIGLIPVLGALVLLVFNVTEGTIGDNRYGEDPKAGVL